MRFYLLEVRDKADLEIRLFFIMKQNAQGWGKNFYSR